MVYLEFPSRQLSRTKSTFQGDLVLDLVNNRTRGDLLNRELKIPQKISVNLE